MVVYCDDWRCSCSPNMGEAGCGGCIRTETSEVSVMERRLSVLVSAYIELAWGMLSWYEGITQGRTDALASTKILSGRSVPSHSKSVNVKEPIANSNFMFGGDFVWIVREQFWKVVFMYLLCQRMCLNIPG